MSKNIVIFRAMSNKIAKTHTKCIGSNDYPRTNGQVKRGWVPTQNIDWAVSFLDYTPVSYTAPSIQANPSYADLEIGCPTFNPNWNALDGNVNRKSHNGIYMVENSIPQNPIGRTGMTGRGCLGRWGPNHAADPIVTRWKRTNNGNKFLHENSGRAILEFVAIERGDCGEWAIPGGMVDPGEKVTETLKREFLEEALNSGEMSNGEKIAIDKYMEQLFATGTEVYSGYVDDPRNTDNSWMETVAYHFHDERGVLAKMNLTAGDDAQKVKWMDISGELNLYASHFDFIREVGDNLGAHW